MRTLVESNPVSTCCIWKKLRINSPAPVSSTNASATSVTTSALRILCRPPELVPRPPSFMQPARFGRVACSAGASPNTMPVRTDSARVNSSTRASIETSASRGRENGGTASSSAAFNASPSASPSTPPQTDSNTFSVRNCRTSLHLPAPTEARIATSRSRDVPRASVRLARFAQPISSTMPTADSSTYSDWRSCVPTTVSANGSIATPQPLFESG